MTSIIDLAPDQKITAPGFYRLPLERHHNQPCDGPSVTSGILRKMELATPADVWATHALNPDRYEPEPLTAAIRQGVAMAAFVEGGIRYVLRHFKLHAKTKPRRPTAAQIAKYDAGEATKTGKASVEYWRQVEESPSIYLEREEVRNIAAMGKALMRDPSATAVMDGVPEITMAWQDEETGLWLLSRPDTVNFDGSMSDYKKMATRGDPFSARVVDMRITQYGYGMQMAFGAEVFERLTGEWPGAVGIVAQWEKRPYHVILREISEEDLRMDQFRNRRAIRNFAHCLKTGHWPGPGEHVGAYQRPQWQHDQLLEEMDKGAGA